MNPMTHAAADLDGVRTAVVAQIRRSAPNQRSLPAMLDDHLHLRSLGFDSLAVVGLLADLESSLALDLARAAHFDAPVTIADVVGMVRVARG